LNEKNYVDWCYMMEALLIEKDLWNIVDGTKGHPTGHQHLQNCLR
jgi:Domain of unknown function (DUF4219)